MELKLDGNKLLYHLEELNKWSRGEDFYPIYVELSPTSACNQRCIHCYIRYLGFKTVFLERELMLNLVRQLGRIGVKALCIAGTGEPFLNKATVEVINEAKRSGLDVACATNGVLFTKETAQRVLKDLAWIRFSVLGGSKATYKKLQGASAADWQRLITNIKDSVEIKKKEHLDVTIGVVFFIFKENGKEALRFTSKMRELGVDYVAIKPTGDYERNKYRADKNLKQLFFQELKAAEKLTGKDFKVQVRWDMFEGWGSKPYKECLSLPFMTVIDSDGGIYACGGYWQDKRYSYGNLHKQSFQEIWDSQIRKRLMKKIEKTVNLGECYNCCRNHSINSFLGSLKQRPAHINFI